MRSTIPYESANTAPLGKRIAARLRPERGRLYRYDTALWRAASAGVWTAGSAMAAVSILGAPTGLGAGLDIAAAVAMNMAGLMLAGRLAAWLFAALRLAAPGFAAGAALYTVAEIALLLYVNDLGWAFSLVFALVSTAVAALAGALLRLTLSRRFAWRVKLGAWLAAALLAASAAYAADRAGEPAGLPASAQAGRAGASAGPWLADDPSQPGGYAYFAFTYGSGQDRWRPEYGSDADIVSSSVDASAYIDDWPWFRKWFWGFDERSLPLNGSVWMPEGEGPFPLVLIVHGNHLMEDFSDGGYAYLGELLASRGFIAVSIDENFLNYSAWSGIPDEDMKPRAWLLLKHIQQIQAFAADASTPFFGRVDFGLIALIGHSRGGQAVAMAAAADQWFAQDGSLPDRGSYTIQSVAALAPTDTAVDGKRTALRDISYLTLQGAADADITNFYGDRQYRRVSFSPSSHRFKASLYIAGANHGQFNTSWGRLDDSLPAGLFLRAPALSGEQQRQIAKVYLAAFAEATLHGKDEYRRLFRDYRAGAPFLPDTGYWSRYEDGGFVPVVRYEEAGDIRSLPHGVKAEAAGVSFWSHEEAKDRDGNGTGNKAVKLKWNEAAKYTLFSKGALALPGVWENGADGASLTFAMADPGEEPGDETEDPDSAEEPDEARPNQEEDMRQKEDGTSDPLSAVEVELADEFGAAVRIKLSDIMPVSPSPATTFTRLPWLEKTMDGGKYDEPVQSVFQTYEIPLERFEEQNPDFDAEDITRITFVFPEGPGQAMLDDIGFS